MKKLTKVLNNNGVLYITVVQFLTIQIGRAYIQTIKHEKNPLLFVCKLYQLSTMDR